LVLICTSPGLPSIPGRPQVVGENADSETFPGADHAAGLLYAGDIGSHGDEVRRLFRDSQVGGSGLGYLNQLAAAAGCSSLPFLGPIRQPVLVMGGDADPIVPIVPVANARILAGLIPNATLHVFNGGHVEPLAAARDFGPVISRFLLREQPSPWCDWQCGHRVGHVR
jgi:pimeloyl-ACP methyl ester carboxylesterase